MRNLVDRERLRELVSYHGTPCVSVYAPTHPAGVDTKQDPVRFKNLLARAEDMLVEQGVRTTEAREVLAPGREMLDDRYFWTEGAPGVAMFLSKGDMRLFRVPFEVSEAVIVNSRYHASPLMPLLAEDGRFYVIALSRDSARLFQCSRHDIVQVGLGDTPTSLADALRGEDWRDQTRSWHSSMPSPSGQLRGGIGPISHGKGDTGDFIKNETLRFFQALDKGVAEALKHETAPLVAACVEYEFPLWERANSYRYLVPKWIDGNPDLVRPGELRDRAWSIVAPYLEHERHAAIGRLGEFSGTDRASADIEEVVAAAFYGRVETLFVSTADDRWGSFDPQTGRAEAHEQPLPGDEPLADFAAVHTFLNDGKVWALPEEGMPNGAGVAALYRYVQAGVY